ncbi:MAG: hypothetical protein Q4B95_09335 [Lonepinella koalarum]|nr:hypothetical protein [Lonepinella koalarum]
MPSVKQVKIYNFTDPMMGLSYESEPFFRQLDTHFGRQVALKTGVLDFDGFVAMIRHISCRQIVPTKPTLI